MNTLLRFLNRYHVIILFLLLQGVCVLLMLGSTRYQRSRLVNGLRSITDPVYEYVTDVKDYLSLETENRRLALENTQLKNSLASILKEEEVFFFSREDSLNNQRYYYTRAEVVNNSVIRQKNYFTINKGSRDGLQADMGVISSQGVAGIIRGTSENYAIAISLLNLDFRLSAMIRKNGYFGSLVWDGADYRQARLREIPNHVVVHVGDTIVTSGFSALFPKDIPVGTVVELGEGESNFHEIIVELSVDFRQLNHVQVVHNLTKLEQEELEEEIEDA